RLPGNVTAIDLSPIAVRRANGAAAASVLALPFPDASFDAVLAIDGPNSWFLTEEELQNAYSEMHRVVKRGGNVLITDYEKPRNMDRFIERVERSPLQIQSVGYIHDRLWYKIERALPFIKGSRALASFATSASRIAGRTTANHIIVRTSRAAL
ncbi:MAG TPA: class I SAM-dependent methyltransferase, partial [Longimicrobiales bacterium]|nr:class I SAM-dependent methyltransferase [Longimicrobiales bacterium]